MRATRRVDPMLAFGRGCAVAGVLLLVASYACDPFPDVSTFGAAPANADGSASDGGPGGGGESGSDTGAPAAFCASSTHTFCSDFDQTSLLPGNWDEADPGLELIETLVKSPPHALHGTLPRAAAGTPQRMLTKRFATDWVKTVLELDISMARPSWKAGDAGNVFLGQIRLNQNVAYSLFVDSNNHVGISGDTPDYMYLPSSGQLEYGKYTHIRFTLDPKSTGGSFELAIGEPPVVVLHQNADLKNERGSGMLLQLGLGQWNVPAPDIDVSIDNVTLDLSP